MTTTSTASRSIGQLGAFAALCVALVSCSASSNTTQTSSGTATAGASAAAGVGPGNSAEPAASAAPAAKGAAIDPCSLLTDTEAGTALGGSATHAVVAPRDGGNGSGLRVTENRCSYNLITSDQTGHEIYVAVYDGANREYFDETANDSDHSAVPGLGESATADAQIDVFVFGKGTMLEIYGSLGDGDGLQQIAKLAIAKL